MSPRASTFCKNGGQARWTLQSSEYVEAVGWQPYLRFGERGAGQLHHPDQVLPNITSPNSTLNIAWQYAHWLSLYGRLGTQSYVAPHAGHFTTSDAPSPNSRRYSASSWSERSTASICLYAAREKSAAAEIRVASRVT